MNHLLLLQELNGFANILDLVDPEATTANMPNLFPGDDLQQTNEQATITDVCEQIVHMMTNLRNRKERRKKLEEGGGEERRGKMKKGRRGRRGGEER